MVGLDLDAAGIAVEDLITLRREEGVRLMGGRIVVRFQIVDKAFRRLERVMDRVLAEGRSDVVSNAQSVHRQRRSMRKEEAK
ncbi:hypothetical protein WAI453_009001 [Rhynchosporium graminicola]